MAGSKTEPVLSEGDVKTGVWMKVHRHLEARLAQLRAKNDKDLDERKTAGLRGQIEEVKRLMALDKPAPPMEADE